MFTSIVRSSVILVVLLALTVIASACYLPPPRPLPDTPTAAVPTAAAPTATPTPAAPALTSAQLGNAVYSSEVAQGRKVTLVNGKFEASTGAGARQKLTVTLTEPSAVGDLNGDAVADAAVVLATNTGGTGIFKALHAVLNQAGQPVEAAAIQLGDRVQVKSLTIQSGAILVDLLTHGPKDGLCCPTMEVIQTYKLQGNTLVLVSVVQKPTIRLAQ